jgi:hypothetical protein
MAELRRIYGLIVDWRLVRILGIPVDFANAAGLPIR